MKTIIGIIPLLLCVGTTSVRPDMVSEAFGRGDFLPHVISDRDLVDRYGVGAVVRSEEGMKRIFAAESCNAWLGATIYDDATHPEFRTVEEVLVSALPLSEDRFPYEGDMCSLKLGGISLGDDRSVVLRSFEGKVVRMANANFLGRSVEEIYVNPVSEDTNLYFRILVDGQTVIAMAMGVTE